MLDEFLQLRAGRAAGAALHELTHHLQGKHPSARCNHISMQFEVGTAACTVTATYRGATAN